MSDDFLVRLSDSDGTGYCVKGQRAWFEERGLPWRDYCRSGIPARLLIATGDDHALRVVENARKNRGTNDG